MKPSELRGKNGEELQKELESLLRAQFGLRMQLATQQLSNTSQLPIPWLLGRGTCSNPNSGGWTWGGGSSMTGAECR